MKKLIILIKRRKDSLFGLVFLILACGIFIHMWRTPHVTPMAVWDKASTLSNEYITVVAQINEDIPHSQFIVDYTIQIQPRDTTPLCVDVVYLMLSIQSYGSPFKQYYAAQNAHLCVNEQSAKNYHVVHQGSVTIPLNTVYNYKYPYDEHGIGMFLWYRINGTYQRLPIAWMVNARENNVELNAFDGENVLISIKRLFLRRILTLVLIIILLVIVMALMVIHDMGVLYQGIVGVLFGLWSIRQILVPASVSESILLDNTFIILYCLFAMIVLYKLITVHFTKNPANE
jgi:hypothetical protein